MGESFVTTSDGIRAAIVDPKPVETVPTVTLFDAHGSRIVVNRLDTSEFLARKDDSGAACFFTERPKTADEIATETARAAAEKARAEAEQTLAEAQAIKDKAQADADAAAASAAGRGKSR